MTHSTYQLLTSQWITQFKQFNRLIVGFSGGLDSTVLLHALAAVPELFPKLVAVHVNHGISPQASSWQTHCEQFGRTFGISFIARTVEFDRTANLEERARIARYAVFSSLLTENDCLILGHHQDDQAETVLLQLFRGSGIDGLAAMSELGSFDCAALARPFLNHTRMELERYAALHQLTWIEDESNVDIHYSRNYLRQNIVPLLVAKWPGLIKNIARTAGHCQQAQHNLDDLAFSDCPDLLHSKNKLNIDKLQRLPTERLTNVLRVWIRKNHQRLPTTTTFLRLIHEMIFARTDAIPEVQWGDNVVRRYQNYLYLSKKNESFSFPCIEWLNFPHCLGIPATNMSLSAIQANQGLFIPEGAKLWIRFRQGGEKFFWHGQTKQLKKLFQQWAIPPWCRDQVPLLYVNEQLAMVVGYAVSDRFFVKTLQPAWQVTVNF